MKNAGHKTLVILSTHTHTHTLTHTYIQTHSVFV